MVAYLGTNSFRDICSRAEAGDQDAGLIIDAAAYQVGKEIGALAAILEGTVDAIILTGGMAYQESFTEKIRRMTEFIARIVIYPGEDELRALAYNGLLVLDSKISPKEYN
jgi:butyrate kinase